MTPHLLQGIVSYVPPRGFTSAQNARTCDVDDMTPNADLQRCERCCNVGAHVHWILYTTAPIIDKRFEDSLESWRRMVPIIFLLEDHWVGGCELW